MHCIKTNKRIFKLFSLSGSHTILHCESKKLDPFSFEHNFRKYCPVVIILLLFRQKLSTHKHIIEFPTSPIVCCSTALKNATAYTSSQKLLNKSAMHAVISLLLQSRKFWCYLLLTTLKRRHNNVILLSAIRMCLVTTVFQQDSYTGTPRCARAAVELYASRNAKLSCAQPAASKQPRSQSCGLRDLGCHAALCLPQTNP